MDCQFGNAALCAAQDQPILAKNDNFLSFNSAKGGVFS
jgi:hypothetical protein